MKKLLLCGFPGVGKTFASRAHGWQDSDSSRFSWISEGVRNPEFPANYIQWLRDSDGIVLVSSHLEVRDALAAAREPFWIAFPDRGAKLEYLARYERRGSHRQFLDLLSENWDAWIAGMESETRCVGRLILQRGEYLSDFADLLTSKLADR